MYICNIKSMLLSANIIMKVRRKQLFSSLLLLLLLFGGKAYALYLSSDISSLEPNNSFFSKPYVNDTKKVNLYTFSAYQIDKPNEKEQGNAIKDGEIIFTPLKKVLLPGEQEYFKIFYRGQEDNKERYYKIVISETALDVQSDSRQNRQSLFYPTVSLETYFVVRPKNIDFKYEINSDSGVLKNTGNTYFRVLIHQSCEVDENEVPLMLYLLPQQEFRDSSMKKKSRKYIVIFNKYYSIGNCEGAK